MEAIAKFAADRMLARTARWLRMLGADTLFDDPSNRASPARMENPYGVEFPIYHNDRDTVSGLDGHKQAGCIRN